MRLFQPQPRLKCILRIYLIARHKTSVQPESKAAPGLAVGVGVGDGMGDGDGVGDGDGLGVGVAQQVVSVVTSQSVAYMSGERYSGSPNVGGSGPGTGAGALILPVTVCV